MQVMEDQKLLREKVHHLSGDAGIERMDSSLSETRSKYFLAKEKGSPMALQITHIISPSPPSLTASPSVASSEKRDNVVKSVEKPSRVVRALFREEDTPKESSASTSRTILDGQLGFSVEKLVMENELIVNEYIHNQHGAFTDIYNLTGEGQSSVKVSATS